MSRHPVFNSIWDAPSATWTAGVNRGESWLAAGRPQRVVGVLLAIWMLNGYDLWMTVEAFRHGLLAELNPVAAMILPTGVAAITLYKLSLVTLGSTLLFRCRHAAASELGVWVTLVIYGLVTSHWFECWAWYSITLESGSYFTSVSI